jgi:hypothetical protein
MSTFNDASPRQQDILSQLGRRMGFSVNDLTNITYTGDIPTEVRFARPDGNFTRSTLSELGGIITDGEQNALKTLRREEYAVPLADSGRSNGNKNFSAPATQGINDPTADATAALRNSTLSISDPSTNRLAASGLSNGATTTRSDSNLQVARFPSAARDLRVKISDPSGRIAREGGPLAPLQQTDHKVVFPYTPDITLTHSASYSSLSPTHSNYEYLFYQNSTVSEISISAVFTARNAYDADYVLAVQHFFRSVTKMFYGQDDVAGLPPIVCRLEGHGDLMFSYVPVAITNFNITLPSDVDYISSTNPNNGRVPTMQTMQISARPLYSRSRITNEFSLTKFARGQMLGDTTTGRGGFI